jgi:hypothetical protein
MSVLRREELGMVMRRAALWAWFLAFPACAPKEPPPIEYPTTESVVANATSFGVPYGRVVLLAQGETCVALKVEATSTLGDHVHYEWVSCDGGSLSFAGPTARRGSGEAVEQCYVGRINAGSVSLMWSRGSREFGWLYWPQQGPAFKVADRAWMRVEDLPQRRNEVSWIENPVKKR